MIHSSLSAIDSSYIPLHLSAGFGYAARNGYAVFEGCGPALNMRNKKAVRLRLMQVIQTL
ncbi:hypothetical protein BH10BAC3_BH10BAC3_29020 [soil metagenome]